MRKIAATILQEEIKSADNKTSCFFLLRPTPLVLLLGDRKPEVPEAIPLPQCPVLLLQTLFDKTFLFSFTTKSVGEIPIADMDGCISC